MFGIDSYGSFIAAILIFQAVPGPGTLAILNATARYGVAVGVAAVCGTLLGDAVFMIAAVAGLAAVLQSQPVWLELLQACGAAYLVWLGWQLWRARLDPVEAVGQAMPALRQARQALLVSLSNPKVVLFFVAFFPLFLRPGASGTTLLVMMLHVTLISLAYQLALVLVGNAVARRLRAWPSARRLATRLAGIALMAFGVRLALGR